MIVLAMRSMFLSFYLVCTILLCNFADTLHVSEQPQNGLPNDTIAHHSEWFVAGESHVEKQPDGTLLEWMDPVWTIHELPSGQRVVLEHLDQNRSIPDDDDDHDSPPMRVVQDMNASVHIVWEQIYHYLSTAAWNVSVAKIFGLELYVQYNETVNVTLPPARNETMEKPSLSRRSRRSKQAVNEIHQEQYILGIQLQLKLLPFLFNEQSYFLRYTLVPQHRVIFWNWTFENASSLHSRENDDIAEITPTVHFGSGFAYLASQSSDLPSTRLYHFMAMEWSKVVPSLVSKLLLYVPPVERMFRGCFTRFFMNKAIRRIKEQSETLQSVALSKNVSVDDCSSIHPLSHRRLPLAVRQWWRNIRRILPSKEGHNNHSEESFCEARATNVTLSSPFNQTNISAHVPGVRPIGVTRYVLVCSVLSLTLFNVYLYFS